MSDQSTDLMVLPEGIGEDSSGSKSRERDEPKEGDSATNTDMQPMDDSVHIPQSKFVI